MDIKEIVEYATKLNINVNEKDINKFKPESDGLSGGVSKLYKFFNKIISCEDAGIVHDYLYRIKGGSEIDRMLADRLFCYACMLSGKTLPNWLMNIYTGHRQISLFPLFFWIPIVRLSWRTLRAFIMFCIVRLLGWKFFNYKKDK